VRYLRIAGMHELISDTAAPKAAVQSLRSQGVTVTLV